MTWTDLGGWPLTASLLSSARGKISAGGRSPRAFCPARAHCLADAGFVVDRRGFVGATASCLDPDRAIGGGGDCDESAITHSHTLEPSKLGWSCGRADKTTPTSYVICVDAEAWAGLEVEFDSADQMPGLMIASGGCVGADSGISAALYDPAKTKWRCAPSSYEPPGTFLATEGE